MKNKKKRQLLAVFTGGILLVIMVFLAIVNAGQPKSMQDELNLTLVILGIFALAVLTLFLYFGDIFQEDGTLQRSQILLMVTAVIFVMQLTLAFATYSFKQLEFERASLQEAKKLYFQIEPSLFQPDFSLEHIPLKDEISRISLADESGQVIKSSDPKLVGEEIVIDPLTSYRFTQGSSTVVMEMSFTHQREMVGRVLLDLLTVLVASIILSIELVIFMIKFVEDRYADAVSFARSQGHGMVDYVRQISFLFYFASSLPVAFIAIIALELGGSLWGFSGNVLAGFPQSAEFLFTCVAIFATARIIEKRGWKVSFIGGLVIVAIGTGLSALAPNILLFIVARAVVGLGYGFCWMTLRNFALFTKEECDKNNCFAMLNAGIYAGIICGAGLGSVLADILGYGPVLWIAAILTGFCSLAILRLNNARYRQPAAQAQGFVRGYARYLPQVIFFVLLMIIPACIVGSFLGYYLPIYFMEIGKTTSDIGRAQLIYSLIIVYAGPVIVQVMNRYLNLFRWNLIYNLMFSLALIIFGLTGGFIQAMLVVVVFGLADSFGFVAQNNYFLSMEYVKRAGESRALSYVSLIKKQAEMLGPIGFGLTFACGSYQGLAIMGMIFVAAALIYGIADQGLRKLMR